MRQVHDDGTCARPTARREAHHRGVVAQRRDGGAAPQHQQLVGERRAGERTPGIPREAIADHGAPLHLAARTELAPEPLVGRREIGIVRRAHAVHAQVAPRARPHLPVARREVFGEQCGFHGGRS